MGAYTVASASHFNGFKPPNARYFISTAVIKKNKEEKKEEVKK